MKITLLNSHDRAGGAARAANRLHLALRDLGIDARMLVQIKQGDQASVIGPQTAAGLLTANLRPAADLLPTLVYPRRTKATFYPGWLPERMARRVKAMQPDIVHLHWITGGALNVRSLRKVGRPLVWTLHDMWAFTGGCHYDDGCGRFNNGCGRCPVLGSGSVFDLSRIGWRRKLRAYRNLTLRIVTPSRWLGEKVRDSALLGRYPVSVIPNPIDTRLFRPIDRRLARDLLGLPPDRSIVLFGALRSTSDRRKGFGLLRPALQEFGRTDRGRESCAVIFGASRPDEAPDLGMDCIFMGTLADDLSLCLLYCAADVLVAPSTQENLSNTVMESLSCGTPAVTFRVGGMPDMVEHQVNGYLAQPFESEDLARGIGWVLQDGRRHLALSASARAKVLEEFDQAKIARRYVALYEETMQSAKERR